MMTDVSYDSVLYKIFELVIIASSFVLMTIINESFIIATRMHVFLITCNIYMVSVKAAGHFSFFQLHTTILSLSPDSWKYIVSMYN